MTSDPSVGQSSSIVPPLETKVKSVAEKLNLITDFLFQLLKKVELIRSYTEQVYNNCLTDCKCGGFSNLLANYLVQKSSHEQGYHAAINCLHDISKFSRIKNATVLAALRAPSSNSTSNSTLKAPVKIIQGQHFIYDTRNTLECP